MATKRSPESIAKQKATFAENRKKRAGKKRTAKKKRRRPVRQLQRPVSHSKPGSDLDRCIEQIREAGEGLAALKRSLKEVFGYE